MMMASLSLPVFEKVVGLHRKKKELKQKVALLKGQIKNPKEKMFFSDEFWSCSF
jgi:hypothetical protein